MSLTPKNWGTFQHYKDRAPAWIKLHRGLLDDFTFHRLPVASRALAPCLWLLASEYEHGTITAGDDEIAFRLRMSVGDLRDALKPLIEAGFFILAHDASEALADCKRDAMPEKEKEGEREKEREKEEDTRAISDRPARTPSRFDEFWQAYPRRDGPNPRKPAETKFNALVKSGLDPEFLISEVKKFNAAEASRGNIGTRFIPQAVTWINQQRWSDHAAVAALAAISQAMTIEQAVVQFARFGIWSKHAPVSDVSQAPSDLLAKHGLGSDGRKLATVAA